MSKIIVEDYRLTDIADAIRLKTGGLEQLTLAQMPASIKSISGGGSSAYSGLQIYQLPSTYKVVSATSFSSWKSQMETAGIPLSLDLTTYGIQEDWSNFGALIFTYGYYSPSNEANKYGAAILYRDMGGNLKIKNHDSSSANWTGYSEETKNNISFIPWTDTTKTEPADWEIHPNNFPVDNVSFYSRYYRSNYTTYVLGDCVAFYGGELIRLI